jgi:hypothetical protein
MAEQMPYPYYRLTGSGPDETGFVLSIRIEEGAGGPVAGHTTDSVLAGIRELLAKDNDSVSTALTRFEITTTSNL